MSGAGLSPERRRELLMARVLASGPRAPRPVVSGLTAASAPPATGRSLLKDGWRAPVTQGEFVSLVSRMTLALRTLPPGMLDAWHWKLTVAYALLWDYVETVCEVAAQQRLERLRPLTREMRRLAAKYHSDNEPVLLRDFMRKAEEDAGGLEAALSDELGEMARGLKTEMMCAGLSDRRRYFQMAVAQASVMLSAITLYGLELDRRIDSYAGPQQAPPCRLVEGSVLRLRPLLDGCRDRKLPHVLKAEREAARRIGVELINGRVNTDHGEMI